MDIGQANLSTLNVKIIEKEEAISKKICKEKVNKKMYKVTKRICDIIFSVIGLIILSPIFLIISIAIKLDSKGTAFFAHKRIGKNGKIINIYKFRTMLPNAEDMIKNFDEEQMKEFRENYKLKNDPRITRIGKFLRKTSLDELPQIVNIIKGELSIIGPRPIIEVELQKYGNKKDKLLSVTPGLTGYWQANGRSCTTYNERIKMELYYVDNCSFWLDFKVFFKTIISVFKKDGAI